MLLQAPAYSLHMLLQSSADWMWRLFSEWSRSLQLQLLEVSSQKQQTPSSIFSRGLLPQDALKYHAVNIMQHGGDPAHRNCSGLVMTSCVHLYMLGAVRAQFSVPSAVGCVLKGCRFACIMVLSQASVPCIMCQGKSIRDDLCSSLVCQVSVGRCFPAFRSVCSSA